MTNNLPILYFTLGALVGLPIGYYFGFLWEVIFEPVIGILSGARAIDKYITGWVVLMNAHAEPA